MTVFTIASALAGYAPSAVFLIGARALQGLGAALMYPQVLSIIQVTFKGSERSLALGLFAAISGIGAITGNIVGGLLIQLNLAGLSWRPIFLVNVPVGIIGVVAGLLVLHPSRTERAPKLDLPGVGLISLFLVSLILPLAEGQQIGWPNWMVMLLALSFPVLALFVHLRAQEDKQGRRPTGRYGPVQASVVRSRHSTNPPILRHCERALLYARPVPTIGSRILAHHLRALIRPAQHWLYHGVTSRATTNRKIRKPRPQPCIHPTNSRSRLDNTSPQLLRNRSHSLRAIASTHSIRSRCRVCAVTTAWSHSFRSSKPGGGRSIRSSLYFVPDREHGRHLALRTPLLSLSQRSTITDLVHRRVQDDCSLFRDTVSRFRILRNLNT